MKKFYFLAVAALALMASCTKTELVTTDNDMKPISMEIFQHKATKASEITGSNVTSTEFNIQCYQMNGTSSGTSSTATAFYENKTLAYSDGKWDTTPTYYWPYDCVTEGSHTATNSLSFFAYNLGTFAKGNYPTATAEPTLTYTVADAAADQKDVIAARMEYKTWHDSQNASKVDLSFNHILSEICFTVIGAETGFSYEIDNVTIGNSAGDTPAPQLLSEAVYTFGNSTVATSTSEKKAYSYSDTPFKTIAANTTTPVALSDEVLMLVPQAATAATISVTFRVKSGDTVVYEGTKTTGTLAETWVPGSKYTYSLTLSGGHPIEYAVSVSDWTGATTSDVTLQ